LAHFYRGRTAKMPHGMEVGLSPEDCEINTCCS